MNQCHVKNKNGFTRFQDINHKEQIIKKYIYRRLYYENNTVFLYMMNVIKNRLKNMKWGLSFIEADEDVKEYYKKQCEKIGIVIKVLGGNEKHVYKEVFDSHTGKPVTWAELIERSKAK